MTADAGCQTPGSRDTACNPTGLPWAGDPRAEVKTQIWRVVARHPEGINLPRLAQLVFGYDVEIGEADYRLTKRLVENNPEYVETEGYGGRRWVFPTPATLSCYRSMQSVETQEGGGMMFDTVDEPAKYAKDRAADTLESVMRLPSDTLRAELLEELARERRAIDDRVTILERIRGSGPEYILKEYETRFNSPSRSGKLLRKWKAAWDRATYRYDRAVLLTITADPKMHDSQAEAVDALFSAKNDLTGWLTYDAKEGTRPGYRPENMSVLEWGDGDGLPHLHVVYFGVGWLETATKLREELGDRVGRRVGIGTYHNRDGRWVPTGAGGEARDLRSYLSKALRDLDRVASMSADDLEEVAASIRAGEETVVNADLWKIACYWTLERRFYTLSPTLREDEPGKTDAPTAEDVENGNVDRSDLPHVARYEFVGVARLSDLPAYIRPGSNAEIWRRDRGPPAPDAKD